MALAPIQIPITKFTALVKVFDTTPLGPVAMALLLLSIQYDPFGHSYRAMLSLYISMLCRSQKLLPEICGNQHEATNLYPSAGFSGTLYRPLELMEQG